MPIQEQHEALKVLKDKKILHPELIEAHFNAIMPLSDRDLVKKYLGHLLKSMSYLGYTGNV